MNKYCECCGQLLPAEKHKYVPAKFSEAPVGKTFYFWESKTHPEVEAVKIEPVLIDWETVHNAKILDAGVGRGTLWLSGDQPVWYKE